MSSLIIPTLLGNTDMSIICRCRTFHLVHYIKFVELVGAVIPLSFSFLYISLLAVNAFRVQRVHFTFPNFGFQNEYQFALSPVRFGMMRRMLAESGTLECFKRIGLCLEREYLIICMHL